jgi:O-antigen/teichoic acid export membrane protein
MMLMMPLNLITGIFSSVLLPSFVKHKNEGGDVESEYYFILKIISIINLPVAVILILFPQTLVRTLWGEHWMQVAELLPYFGLLVLTQTLMSTLGSLLVVQHQEKALMYSGWINAIFMVTGIAIGSFFSLTSIAAFYALAYIVLVIPFNVVYVFAMRLKFVQGILFFWVPRLLLSIFLWIAIYNKTYNMLALVLLLWIGLILWSAKTEIRKSMKLLYIKFKVTRSI